VQIFDEDVGSVDDSLGKCSITIRKDQPFTLHDGQWFSPLTRLRIIWTGPPPKSSNRANHHLSISAPLPVDPRQAPPPPPWC
jgi:hypothetical protein